MAFLLGKKLHKHRSPEELVKAAKEQFQHLGNDTDHKEKYLEKLSRYIAEMKVTMLGDGEDPPQQEAALILSVESCKQDLVSMMCIRLPLLEFESRKDTAAVFGQILRAEKNGRSFGAEYLQSNLHILTKIFSGYEDGAVALVCGTVLTGPLFEQLFRYVELENFEVASDAFQTLKDLLTRHKKMVAEYLMANYEEFFSKYTSLLKSQNYVTRRQSVKLLGELLLDRANVKVMLRYVSQRDNLILMMNLLKDSSRSIQFEAFHVFKVFVANPSKPDEIVDILVGNKEKLLLFLRDFHSDKDDEQFKEEKAVIMKEISQLGVSPAEGED
uniref:Calcium binding protein 39 n=1 Tax=Tetraselmis sp. GSL018 TaxID=582737 RepID=A0A061QMF7_9CHLO|eukprot:CAMPEP_0177627162 /NCGR_PEP_ID=MMETSP0419_2-20121207/31053_1 /TAXON_ID=582737 /ORGANISM="Tetraselmis sp., Strain GSL018" /LENGTH=327 /DNA_ID=CAMNT_0019128291 /DNA_START=264 /DNA_END=1247 /DNA_ORIENTATION=+